MDANFVLLDYRETKFLFRHPNYTTTVLAMRALNLIPILLIYDSQWLETGRFSCSRQETTEWNYGIPREKERQEVVEAVKFKESSKSMCPSFPTSFGPSLSMTLPLMDDVSAVNIDWTWLSNISLLKSCAGLKGVSWDSEDGRCSFMWDHTGWVKTEQEKKSTYTSRYHSAEASSSDLTFDSVSCCLALHHQNHPFSCLWVFKKTGDVLEAWMELMMAEPKVLNVLPGKV